MTSLLKEAGLELGCGNLQNTVSKYVGVTAQGSFSCSFSSTLEANHQ